MRNFVAGSTVLALSTVGAFAAGAIALSGADELAGVTLDLVGATGDPGTPLCPAASGLTYLAGGSSAGETAMAAGTQSIAPMARPLGGPACAASGSAGSPSTAEQLVVGLNALALMGATTSASTPACNGSTLDCDSNTDPSAGLAWNSTVTRPTKGAYTFNGWQDVLRILYGGVSSDPIDTGCDSEIRKYLANHWSQIFQDGCANGDSTCTTALMQFGARQLTLGQAVGNTDGAAPLWHLFRPDDGSASSSIFAALIGLTPAPSASALHGFGVSPFCNALNWDVSPANGTNCTLGKYKQYVGPGGIPDTHAGDGVHRRPPQGTWGDDPDPSSPYGAAALPTSYQDNDPVRRPCVGRKNVIGNTLYPAEEVCNIDGSLGLVVPVSSMDFITQQNPNVSAFPTSACVGWNSGPTFSVHKCAPRGTFAQACPNGDYAFGGSCMIPTSAAAGSSCETQPTGWPQMGTHPAGDGRIYNLFAFDGGTGYTTFSTGGGSVVYSGAFGRIHQTLPLWDSQGATAPASNAACQHPTAGDQLACLAQASPCSLALADSASTQSGIAALKVAAMDPAPTCIETRTYPLWNKLYLNTLVGFPQVAGPELALAHCEADSTTIDTALARFGFEPLQGGGPPYCEDFNEQVICGAASNVNACAIDAVVAKGGGTVCGNGRAEREEDCDEGAYNGPPPAACSASCRRNPRPGPNDDQASCGSPAPSALPYSSITEHVYVIWYNNPSLPWTSPEQAIVRAFFSNVSSTHWWTAMQHYPLSSLVVGDITLANELTVTEGQSGTPAPSDPFVQSAQSIIANAVDTGALPYDAQGFYIVLPSASDVASSDLGQHFSTATNVKQVSSAYALRANANAIIGGPHGDDPFDTEIDAMAHELAEAIAMPWSCRETAGGQGDEIADLCEASFSNTYVAPGGGTANLDFIAGGTRYDYLIQDLWVPAEGGYCGQGDAPPFYSTVCHSSADCLPYSGICADGLCQVPSCHDDVQNHGESDVDCGTTCGLRSCPNGKKCVVPLDCASLNCVSGTCSP